MHSSARDTLIFLGLASVVFFSFGFLIVAFLINRRETEAEQRSPDPRRSTDAP